MIGKKVHVIVDRPIGTTHPNHKDLVYEVNYGYIPDLIAGDSEEQDAYILGPNEPIKEFDGIVIAIIHRNNDVEDKWVVSKENTHFSDEEILKKVNFQEKYFSITLIR